MLGLSPFDWLIVALAVFRGTRLLNKDLIAEPVRKLGGRAGMKWLDFITCPWCVSMWLAGGAVALSLTVWREVRYLWVVLALSAVAGFFGERS